MKYTQLKDIILPENKAVFSEKSDKDHILGDLMGDDFEVIRESGQYLDSLPVVEIQRNNRGNTYGCVSFSHNNALEIIHKVRYADEPNMCDRYVVVGSGTTIGRGNSKRAVAEWGRKNYWVNEEEWSFTPDMTMLEYYNNGKVPQNLLEEGIAKEPFYTIGYKWLKDNRIETIKNGLKLSPVQVDVEPYQFNGDIIVNSGQGYVHEVLIVGYEEGRFWSVFDSENEQLIKFAWNYRFGDPMIHSIKKKESIIMKYPMIKHNRDIYQLAKFGEYAGKYIRIYSSPTFKSLYGDFSPDKYKNITSLGLPSNMAKDLTTSQMIVLQMPDNLIFAPSNGNIKIDVVGLTNYLMAISSINEDAEPQLVVKE